jgi:hypothetical protein
MKSKEIHVKVDPPEGTDFSWPDCQEQLSCQNHAIGDIRNPANSRRSSRVEFLEWHALNNRVKSGNLPWAESHSRFTTLFKRFAFVILQMTRSVTGAMITTRSNRQGFNACATIPSPLLGPRRTKELLRDFWAQETEGKAKRFFKNWDRRVIRTIMKPMEKLSKTLNERIDNIVTYRTHGIYRVDVTFRGRIMNRGNPFVTS